MVVEGDMVRTETRERRECIASGSDFREGRSVGGSDREANDTSRN
jgi:hypothetical protein